MRILIGIFVLFFSVAAWAADEEEVYAYATYLYCKPMGEAGADESFKKYAAPVYEKAMGSGISGWGYLKHTAGGKWRRAVYHMSSSVTAALKAGDDLNEAIDKEMKPEDDGLGKACHSHDDYIWKSHAGNVADKRGKVSLSVYMVCDMTRESRADELIENELGPLYDQQLKKGKLKSWGWLTHVLGGKYRRLLTMSADNYDDLFAVRGDLLAGIAGTAVGNEFSSICGSHSDYLWDIVIEGR